MSKTDAHIEQLQEVVDLLKNIVETFNDAASRPAREIALYRNYLRLKSGHQVKLAGRFLVINGGGKNPQTLSRRSRPNPQAKSKTATASIAHLGNHDRMISPTKT